MYGEYLFPEPPSALTVWRKMVHGDVKRYVLAVPEGANIYDIAEEIDGIGLLDPDEFLAAATSPALLSRLGFAGPSAEGFLFPDTYVFVKPVTAEEVLGTMLRQFRKRFTDGMATKARAEGYSIPEVVTIASIIEKETGIDAERPLVSAVIRRRLAIGMPLQMDPTVIYGLRRFGENLTKKDLQARNPYNTYVNRGLPPGPIANPGLPSLEAALSPARTDYLYFVSRNDGSHVFSRTLSEHNRAVSRYQRPADPEG